MKFAPAVLIVVPVLLLAACGGSDQPSAAPSEQAANPTSVAESGSPSAAVWSMKEAASQYEEAAAPGNAERERFNALTQERPLDVAAVAKGCGSLAETWEHFARDLQAGLWPSEARPHIEKLTTAVLAGRNDLVACSHATSESEIGAALTPFASSTIADDGARVRLALGLDLPE